MSLGWEVLGLTNQVRCQPGEMPVLTRMLHLNPRVAALGADREMNSEATSSGSPLRAAVPPKGAKVTQKVQTNQTIQDLDEMNDQLSRADERESEESGYEEVRRRS